MGLPVCLPACLPVCLPACLSAPCTGAAAAGRLDYCTDSWALGLLVLSLRKGQQPFWWLKQEGKLPSGVCAGRLARQNP